MATVNLGKIKLKWRGTWSSGGSYTIDDVVEYTDGSVTSSYIAVASSSNQTPSTGGTVNSSYWNYAAKGQASSPTTTQGDVIVRGASADERLAIGSAGQVLKVNSGANGLEYGTGFGGSHYVAYQHQLHHGTSVTANGHGLSNGTADGQRDCILINNGLYFTVTPGHADDRIVINVTTNVYSNWNVAGTYWGFGFMSATSTDFANNRNVFYLSGQHSWGNGGAGGDQYINCAVTQQFDVSDIGLNAGTTYYIRPIAQVHSPNNSVQYVQNNGSNQRSKFNSWLIHYKKNV